MSLLEQERQNFNKLKAIISDEDLVKINAISNDRNKNDKEKIKKLTKYFNNSFSPKVCNFDIQSFNQKTLQAVGRIQNNEKLKEVMRKLIDAGCILHVDLIAGLPYEDLESFKNSFNELFSVGAAELQCGILKLLKGTSLKRKVEEYGYIYDNNPPYSILETNWLSKEELIKMDIYEVYEGDICREP